MSGLAVILVWAILVCLSALTTGVLSVAFIVAELVVAAYGGVLFGNWITRER